MTDPDDFMRNAEAGAGASWTDFLTVAAIALVIVAAWINAGRVFI